MRFISRFTRLLLRTKTQASFGAGLCVGFVLVVSLVWLGSVFVEPVFAQTAVDPNFGLDGQFTEVGVESDQSVQSLAASIINIVLGLLGIVAVGLIIYAGFLWTTAAGNEQQIEKAKLILRNALIGLVIIFSSWAIATFVVSRLQQSSNIDGGGGTGGGGSIPGLLPADRFMVRSFDTSHLGNSSGDRVTLCSSVQAQFNHWLNQNDINAALAAESLQIVRVQEERQNGGDVIDPPEPIALAIDSRGNVIRFDRANDEDWQLHSAFEVHIPKTLSDHANKPLSDCTAQGCTDRGSHYAWTFTTEADNDEQQPQLTTTYPLFPSGERGPDRNVDRSAVFSFDFSESIDLFSLTDVILDADGNEVVILREGSIVLERIASYVAGTSVIDVDVLETIPRDSFDIAVHGNSIQIALNEKHQSSLNDGPYLDPFTWYRLSISGVRDLCGNPMAGALPWVFQTNGNIPGVAFTYPSDKYPRACAETEAFVRFKTSMYDIANTSCAVSPDGGGLVLSGSGFTNRTLHVADPVPSADTGPVNPNQYCKQYDFGTSEDALTIGATYQPRVAYRNPVNDTQEQLERWEFTVASKEQCVNQPYLISLEPSSGGWGKCLTAKGGYLRASDDVFIGLSTSLNTEAPQVVDNETVLSAWDNQSFNLNVRAFKDYGQTSTAVIADFIQQPTLPLPEGADTIVFDVWATSVVPNVPEPVQSNTLSFVAHANETFTGPCLTSLNPSSGAWGRKVDLSGIRLGLSGQSKNVLFQPAVVATDIGAWDTTDAVQEEGAPPLDPNSETTIHDVSVPVLSLDGDVRVVVNGVVSNGLPFDVTAGIGGSCSVAQNICSPDASLCREGLVCGTGCTCQPEQGFRIMTVSPKNSCQDSCTNAVLSFETNKDIDTLGQRVSLWRCTQQNCTEPSEESGVSALAQNIPITLSHPTTSNGDVLMNAVSIVPRQPLPAGQWYRVIVKNLTSGGTGLTNLNYISDTQLESRDSYSWTFKTGAEACGVDHIDVSPNRGRLVDGTKLGYTYTYGATALSRVNSCAPNGQALQLSGQYEWGDGSRTLAAAETLAGTPAQECNFGSGASVGNPYLTVTQGFTHATSTASVAFPADKRTEESAWICVRHTSNRSVVSGAPVTLVPTCSSNADCNNGTCSSTCEQSTGLCRPNITSITPTDGVAGTWMTIRGCYFGNDWGTVRVGGTEATRPDVALCGNTWSSNQVIAEVASSGVVEVIRERDGRVGSSAPTQFGISATEHPAICKVVPTAQAIGSVVDIKGRNFGLLGEQAGVIFANETGSAKSQLAVTTEPSCPETGWQDDHSCIRVVSEAPLGDGEIRVVNRAGQESAGHVFRVIDRIGRTPNAIDVSVGSYFPQGPACVNALVELNFNTQIDASSIGVGLNTELSAEQMAGSHVYVQSGSRYIPGTITLRSTSRTSTIRFYPAENALGINTDYRLVIVGGVNGLRSVTGGVITTQAGDVCDPLSGDNCIISFRTVSAVDDEKCQVTSLELNPSNPVFTCAGNSCEGDAVVSQNGHQRSFQYTAYNGYADPVVLQSEVTWSTSDSSVISFAGVSNGVEQMITIQPKNGSSRVRVASESLGLSTATDARVFLCQNPWPASMRTDGIPFNDTLGSTDFTTKSVKSNFATYYCRDRGEQGVADDLPALGPDADNENNVRVIEFGYNDAGRSVPDLLKEIFLTQPYSRTCIAGDESLQGTTCATSAQCGTGGVCTGEVDAIGVRVLQNKDNQSITHWYASQSFTQGNPKNITLDAFDALQEGTTIYVNAPNDTAPGTDALNTLYNNVYLISINNNAHPDTLDIFNQLVSNWQFMENITNAEAEDALRRDLVRLRDMRTFANILDTQNPPELTSGSYQLGLSLSVWPSWSGSLSSDLQTQLPVDPLNTIVCSTSPTVPSTETCHVRVPHSVGYICNQQQSYFYAYKNRNNQASFMTHLEYTPYPARWNGLIGNGWYGTDDDCLNLSYRQE